MTAWRGNSTTLYHNLIRSSGMGTLEASEHSEIVTCREGRDALHFHELHLVGSADVRYIESWVCCPNVLRLDALFRFLIGLASPPLSLTSCAIIEN